ncbi:uncharacterized protein LOC131891277 [Tigriopus californicus]|uniref:uncharacterized protein LOC131891277 n=1 Tax=Tigriopus californicus TaxID=6832 RepID=UPI0027DAA1CE|nr:uncharacterized protein LOC131891277 [Tigriopus californicus]
MAATRALSNLHMMGLTPVLERQSKYFILHLGGRTDKVSLDRLKVARGVTPEVVAEPPRRRRPQVVAKLVDGRWMDELPLVLLGLRRAWREDSGFSAAELVFGAPLRLPGECLEPTPRDSTASHPLLRHLRDSLRGVAPPPADFHGDPPIHVPQNLATAKYVYMFMSGMTATRNLAKANYVYVRHGGHTVVPPPADFHGDPPVHVPQNLATAKYVYVRHGGHTGPLQPPYDGPYAVLERQSKYFILNLGGRTDKVSLDRLKVARGVTPEVVAEPPRRRRPQVVVQFDPKKKL